MGQIYLPDHVKAAVRGVDLNELERLVEQALREERATSLYSLHLSNCGQYVSERLRRFERELEGLARARAARKRDEMKGRAWSAGSDLRWAIRDILRRIEEEEAERHLVRVDDVISPPYWWRERIEVRVGYQWRRSANDDWTHGSITFVQYVDMSPDLSRPPPRRKPSAAKQDDEREATLHRHWEELVRLGLHAVRDYLKSEGDGNAIPDRFEARPDPRSRWLNNFSCNFWRDQ